MSNPLENLANHVLGIVKYASDTETRLKAEAEDFKTSLIADLDARLKEFEAEITAKFEGATAAVDAVGTKMAEVTGHHQDPTQPAAPEVPMTFAPSDQAIDPNTGLPAAG